jgi:hypothetical protein
MTLAEIAARGSTDKFLVARRARLGSRSLGARLCGERESTPRGIVLAHASVFEALTRK